MKTALLCGFVAATLAVIFGVVVMVYLALGPVPTAVVILLFIACALMSFMPSSSSGDTY